MVTSGVLNVIVEPVAAPVPRPLLIVRFPPAMSVSVPPREP